MQFRNLAASDPSLQWDIHHADLWLQCVTHSSTQQSRRWPCPHCGATKHYPEHCPFRPNAAQQVPGRQWSGNIGQPNTRVPTGTVSAHPSTLPVSSSPQYCKDFNYSLCNCQQCT